MKLVVGQGVCSKGGNMSETIKIVCPECGEVFEVDADIKVYQ